MGDLDALVATTQASLGAVLKRPPLTDKLLARPPFRFLHDILMELLRTVAFLDGLYTDVELVRGCSDLVPQWLAYRANVAAELGQPQGERGQDGLSTKGH